MKTTKLNRALTMSALSVLGVFSAASNSYAVTADDVICDGCVGRVDIGPNEVRAGHIKSYQINAWHLKAGVVKTVKIADGAVNSAKILDNSVTAADLAPGSVGASELAPNSVYSVDIVDGQVTAADIATGAVGASEIATGAVGASEIATGAVGLSEIGANAVNGARIVDGSVTGADIANSSITSSDIANGTITSSDIANGTITRDDIADEPGLDYGAQGSRRVGGTSPIALCSSGYTVLTSRGITPPSSGWMLGFANGVVDMWTANNYVKIIVGDTNGTDSDSINYFAETRTGETSLPKFQKGWNHQVGYGVSAGVTKNVYVKACRETTTTDGTIWWDRLIVTYFPKAY